MSRRIAFWILAAAAVLTAAPAHADRECFENPCRMPDVVESAPAPVAAPTAADRDEGARTEAVPRVEAAPQAAAAPPLALSPALASATARAPSPGGIYPQMMVDQAPRKPKAAAPRRNVDIGPARVPVPRYADTEPRHAAALAPPIAAPIAAAPVEVPARTRPVAVAAPTYVETQPRARAAVIGVPAEVYADDGVVAAYPDPSWKLCQIDERGTGVRYYRCGPYSYHPYGAHGYRPLGSYREYRSAPSYVVAPNAKIISIQQD